MVKSVTSFGRSGVSDWLLQRASAVILAFYVVCMAGFFVSNDSVSFSMWQALFANTAMKIFSLAALFSLVAHAWIGMWTFGTDYIREHYFGGLANLARFAYQAACILALFVYVVWGVLILWGV